MVITTQTDLAAAIPVAKKGDVIVLDGAFVNLPLKQRPDDLTFDCTKATFSGDTYTKGLNGLAIKGGIFTGANPIRVDGGRDIVISGAVFIGPPARTGKAISLSGINGVTISETSIREFHDGIGLTQVDGFSLTHIAIEGAGQDGVHLTAVWNGLLSDVIVHGTRRLTPDTHGDGVQILSLPGIRPTANLVLANVKCFGDIQGVLSTAKVGDGGFDNIVLRRVLTQVAFSNGIAMVAVRGLTIEDCHVETYPMALYPSKLYVASDCSDVRFVGASTQAAYRNKPAVIYP